MKFYKNFRNIALKIRFLHFQIYSNRGEKKLNQKKCNIYPFLKAVRGNWHNALFIKCNHTVCPHGQSPPCEGFLMAVDADGSPILMPAKVLQQLSGESIEPESCQAVIGKRTFESVYGLYIEWHTVSSTGCPLMELCRASDKYHCF